MSVFNIFKKSGKSAVENKVEQHTTASAYQSEKEVSTPRLETASPDIKITGKTKRVHNLIILDESGSMQSIYQPALTGVNETLQTIREAQREHEDQKHFVSLLAFDSRHYNLIYCNTPADNASDIKQEQYRPCGGTPLYDAMGKSINQLRRIVTADDVVLVTVITDGYENASREYNGKAIKALVEEMKGKGWVFTYIGANQDVEAVAASMSIDNRLAFEANDECTGAMFEKECRSRKKFYGKLSSDVPMRDLGAGYFDE